MTMEALRVARLGGGDVAIGSAELEQLKSDIAGRLLRAGDDGWDDAVLLWNAMAATKPALVVQPSSSADVVAALRFARSHGLRISIKGGGHNIAGTAIAEGGLTLEMSRMREVRVEPDDKRVSFGPGCLLQDVDRATQEHGLATVLGFYSEVGAAGLTLGGGLGYLTRRFGWAVDNLIEVEIVTVDGVIRVANREENADLFWALRGGGGNFGVVTRFTSRVHEVGPTVFGGLIAWPFERAEEILRAYRTITTEAPRELAAWLVIFRAPPAPFVPPEMHGKRICAMSVCYTGDRAKTDEALAPIRALGAPVFDLLGERSYVEIQSHLDGSEPKGHHYYWKTEFTDVLSDELLATWRDLAASCPIPEAQLGILHVGGKLNEHDAEDGAIGNRGARYALGAIGAWSADEPGAANFPAWVRDAWTRFRPFSNGGNLINFQTADENDDRIRASYGKNFDRLVAIKKQYDPDNRLRANRNIRPRGGSSAQ